ncbi:MAG: hypothetical protein ACXWAT_00255 [Methylobacter sp.]
MNPILIRAFLSGWFDRQKLRIAHRTRHDAAINTQRRTVTVRTMKAEHWGLV